MENQRNLWWPPIAWPYRAKQLRTRQITARRNISSSKSLLGNRATLIGWLLCSWKNRSGSQKYSGLFVLEYTHGFCKKIRRSVYRQDIRQGWQRDMQSGFYRRQPMDLTNYNYAY